MAPRRRRGVQQACQPRPRGVRQAVGGGGSRRRSVVLVGFGGGAAGEDVCPVFGSQGAVAPRRRRGEQQACQPRPRGVRQAVGGGGSRRRSVVLVGYWLSLAQFLATRALWRHGDGATATSRPFGRE